MTFARSSTSTGRPRRSLTSAVIAAALVLMAPVERVQAGGGDFVGGLAAGVIGATIIHGLANQRGSARVERDSSSRRSRHRENAASEAKGGAESGPVRQDQTDLAELGFYGGSTDGRKSAALESALVQYKLSKGLIGTSILSDSERALLHSEAGQRSVLKSIGDPAADPLLVAEPERRVQVALRELGLYDGPIDGRKGKKLTASISRWQAGGGLVPNGVLSSDQTKQLMAIVSKQAAVRLAAVDQQFAAMAPTQRAPTPPATLLVVAPSGQAAAPASAPTETPFSAIEPLKPAVKAARAQDVAVVIGNRAYQNGIPEVSYGVRDAEAMRAVLVNHLGFNPDNVIMVENATQGDMASVFGNRESHKGKIWKYIDPDGRSKVFVFYSGHGMPDVQSRSPFILPVDANPATVTINGYPLELIYSNLEKLNVQKAWVFLDACFSGGSNTRMLIQSASPVFVSANVDTGARSGKLTIFAASDGDQLASWDDKEGHGLFTSYVMKGLTGAADAEGDGRVTAAKLHAYVLENVRRQARRIYGREQTPVLIGDAEAEIARR